VASKKYTLYLLLVQKSLWPKRNVRKHIAEIQVRKKIRYYSAEINILKNLKPARLYHCCWRRKFCNFFDINKDQRGSNFFIMGITFFRCWRFRYFNWKSKSKALSIASTFFKMGSELLFYTPFMRDAILHQPHTHCNITKN